MKKRSLLTVIFTTLMLTVGMQSFEVAESNFFIGPYITTQSPVSWKVYTNTTIPLDFLASVRGDAPEIVRFLYSVDEASNVTLTNLTKSVTVGGYDFKATFVLKNLAEGNHTLSVYSQDASGNEMFLSFEFMIDTHFTSPLSVLSPRNITYATFDVALTVVCSEQILWATYELDTQVINPQGMGEQRDFENRTLSDLSLGVYEVRIAVGTVRGPFAQTIYFSVSESSGSEPFPTTLVLVLAVSVAIIAVGILVYFKKRKSEADQA